jgi:hypothetical protein
MKRIALALVVVGLFLPACSSRQSGQTVVVTGRVLHHWNDTTPLPAPGVRVVVQPRTDAGTPGEQTAPVFTRAETFTDTTNGRWSVEIPVGMVFPDAPTPSDPVLSIPMPVDIIFDYQVLAGTGTDSATGWTIDTFNVLEYVIQTSITHADTEYIPTVYLSEFQRVNQYIVIHP